MTDSADGIAPVHDPVADRDRLGDVDHRMHIELGDDVKRHDRLIERGAGVAHLNIAHVS